MPDEMLAQMAARTFGEDRVTGVPFHAELEARRGLTVPVDTHVASGHAIHRTIGVI